VPAVTAPNVRGTGGREEGFTVIEVVVASLILVTMLVTASVALTATTRASNSEAGQGATTSSAIIAAQEVENLLGGAWTPAATGGVSTLCAGGTGGQSFATGQGPFVTATTTTLMFCGFSVNASTAYTYDIHFTGCTSSNVCALQIDREPAPNCNPCSSLTVFKLQGVSDSGTPFVYDYYDTSTTPGTWTCVNAAPSCTGQPPASALSTVQAVTVTLTTTTAKGAGTQVTRKILLPNALGGWS